MEESTFSSDGYVEGPDDKLLTFLNDKCTDLMGDDEQSEEMIEELRSLIDGTTDDVTVNLIKTAYMCLLNQQEIKYRKLEDELLILRDEKDQIQQDVQLINENYQQVINDQFKEKVKPYSSTSMEEEDLRSQIEELTQRLELLNLQKNGEIEDKQIIIDELNFTIDILKKENESHLSEIDTVKTNLSAFTSLFADALFVQISDNASDMISEFRQTNKITDEYINIQDFVNVKSEQATILEQLKTRLELNGTSAEELETEIRQKFEKEDELKDKLATQYGIIGDTNTIVQVVGEYQKRSDEIVEKLVQDFDLPPETPKEELTQAIKKRLKDRRRSKKAKKAAKQTELATSPIKFATQEIEPVEEVCEENLEKTEIISSDDQIGYEEDSLLAERDEMIAQQTMRIEELQTTINDNEKEHEQALANIAEMERLVRELQNKLKDVEEERDVLEETVETFKRKVSKNVARIEELEKENEEENKIRKNLDEELTKARLDMQKLELEKEELQSASKENSPDSESEEKGFDVDRLAKAIDLVTQQLQSQVDEIRDHNDSIEKLAGAIGKQQKMMEIMEAEHKKALEKAASSFIPGISKPEDAERFIEALLNGSDQLLEHSMTEEAGKEIEKIAKSDKPLIEKQSSALAVVISLAVGAAIASEDDGIERIRKDNERLLGFLHQNLNFLQRMIDEDPLSLINPKVSGEDEDEEKKMKDEIKEKAIELLKEKVDGVEAFIAENANGYASENYLFDFLEIELDPLKMASKVEELFQAYPDPSKADSSNLFAALCQQVAANAVLQKYAISLKDISERLTRELRALSNETEMATKALEDELTQLNEQIEEEKAKREEAEVAMDNTIGILRSHIGDGNVDAVLSAIEAGEKVDNIDKKSYNRALEQRLNEAMEELKQTREELEQSKLEASQLQEISMQAEETERAKEENAAAIAKLQERLDSQCEEFEDLKEELAQMRARAEDAEAMYEDARRDLEVAKAEHEAKLAEMREELLRKHEKIQQQIRENMEEKNAMTKEDLRVAQKDLERAKDEINEKDRRIKALEDFKEGIFEDQKRRAAEKRSQEAAASETIGKLRTQLRETTSRMKGAELENKLLNARLKAAEERLERDRRNHVAQSSVRSLSSDAQLQAKVDEMKRTADSQMRNFLVEICHTFKDYADFSKPINRESVEELLKAVSDALREGGSESEVAAVRDILAVPKAVSLRSHVTDLARRLRQLRADNEAWAAWAAELAGQQGETEALRQAIAEKVHA